MQQIKHIEAAIASLERLKAECTEPDCRTLGKQVESYKLAKNVCIWFHEIAAEIEIKLCEEAAERVDADLTAADRAAIRDTQAITDALYAADEKAELYLEDIGSGACIEAAE